MKSTIIFLFVATIAVLEGKMSRKLTPRLKRELLTSNATSYDVVFEGEVEGNEITNIVSVGTDVVSGAAVMGPEEKEVSDVDSDVGTSTNDASYKLICYYGSWSSTWAEEGKFLPENINATLCTHIIYTFANMEGGQLSTLSPIEMNGGNVTDFYKRTTSLKALNPKLKILLSLGGWRVGPLKFKNISGTEKSRKIFFSSTPKFLREHGFDGLDLSWQFPSGRVQKGNYFLLIKGLRETFEKEAQDSGRPRLLLSSTMPFGADILRNIAVPLNARYLDFISVETYDFHGPWERKLGHSSQLFVPSSDEDLKKTYSVNFISNMLFKLGIPKEKMMIGMPCFGRNFSPTNASCTTIGCPSTDYDVYSKYTYETIFSAYYEVCEHLHTGGEYVWNEELEVPYMVKRNLWISFDDDHSIRKKMQWIKRNGFGGAMVWAINLDDFRGTMCHGNLQYPLVSIMSEELLGIRRGAEDVDWSAIAERTVTEKTPKGNARSTDGLPPQIGRPWVFLEPLWVIYNDTPVDTVIQTVTVKDVSGERPVLTITKGLLKINPDAKVADVFVAHNLTDKVGNYTVTVTARNSFGVSKEEVELVILPRKWRINPPDVFRTIAIIVLLLLVVLLLLLGFCCWRKRKEKQLQKDLQDADEVDRMETWGKSRKIFPVKPDPWEFSRYKLKKLSVLGEGFFAEVWKCEAEGLHGKPSSLVAVKVLKDTVTGRERQDFWEELKLLKSLDQHENVLPLLACCTDQDQVCIILPYMEGGKLESFLRSLRPHKENVLPTSLTSCDLIRFMCQIASGMGFLSMKWIIHRDLAARNILLDKNRICKVADFGFARDISHTLIYERQGDDRLPIRWMAPETVDDNIHTIKSDVWSFGILMWEIVTLGSTPYPGLRGAEAARMVRAGERLQKPSHCSDDMYGVMLNCWEGNPDNRPSFSELECKLDQLKDESKAEIDHIKIQDFRDYTNYKILTDMTNELV